MDDYQERFWFKVDKEPEGCWLWTGAISKSPSGKHNYGLFSIAGKLKMAHRVAYRWVKGRIPEGLVLDHLCRNTLCVNPDHLEIVTQKENINRGVRYESSKTHCPQGHAYSGENLYITTRGSRECRICRKKQARKAALKRYHGIII